MGWGFKMPSLKDAAKINFNTAMGGGIVGDWAKMKFGPKGKPGGVGPGAKTSFGMLSTENFIKDTPAEQIQRTKLDSSPISRRFGQMRERVGAQFNADAQKNQDALTRRFASMGSTGSGAAIKMQQQAQQEADKMKSDAMRDIDMQEESAQADMANAQAQMDQQVNLAQADMNFRQKAFNFERGSKLHELNLAERQMKIDANTTEFNKRVAMEQMKKPKQGVLSGLLDGWL